MYSQWELEKALPKFREVFFIGRTVPKCTKHIKRLQELNDDDLIRLLKDVDIQQGYTLNKLMKEGVDTIELKPLGKFVSKEFNYKKRGERLDKYFDKLNKSNQSKE